MRIRWWAAAAALTVALAGTARADDPDFISVNAGLIEVGRDRTWGLVGAEYRGEKAFWNFKPLVGAAIEERGAGYVYAGVLLDLFLGNRIVLTGNFAPSFYWRGDGRDLGLPLEFRSGIELAWRFDDRSRLGVALHHLSNANLGKTNIGTETLVVYYALPVSKLF